jgi:sugar (pentulose or hexulose) kinase
LASDGKALVVAMDHALGGMGAGVYADVPSALKELRYAETPVEPVPDHVALYDAFFNQVYQRIYPSLRAVHHEIHHLQIDQ